MPDCDQIPQHLLLDGTAGTYASTPDSAALSLRGTLSALALGAVDSYAGTPAHADFALNADAEIRWEGYVDNFISGGASDQQYFISNYAHNISGWKLYLSSTPTDIRFQASTAGLNAGTSGTHSLAPDTKIRIKVTRTFATGSTSIFAGPATTDWAALPLLAAPAVIFAATTIPSGSATLTVGNGEGRDFAGRAATASVVVGGTTRVNPDFTIAPWVIGDQASTARADSTGKIWTLAVNAEIVALAERRSLRLSGTTVSTPDSVALSIVGDIDLRVKLAMDDWTPAAFTSILSKRDDGTTNPAYRIAINVSGTLDYTWWTAGVGTQKTSSVATGLADGSVKWLKVTHDVDNGAAGNDVKFYTSDDGQTWVQLGTTQTTAGVTTIDDTTARLSIGGIAGQYMAGNVFYAEVRNGIDGTVVANPDFQKRPWDVGETSAATGTDEAGNVWTLNGTGAIIQRAFASDLDIRVKVALDDWTPAAVNALVSKDTWPTDIGYWFRVLSSGVLEFVWSPSGTSSTQKTAVSTTSVVAADGQIKWVRVTLDIDNGAGSKVVTFYTSDDGSVWLPLGSTITTLGTTVLYDSADFLSIGTMHTTAWPLDGKFYYTEVRNGIDGVVVGTFNPSGLPWMPGDAAPTARPSATGEIWTLKGNAVISGDPTCDDFGGSSGGICGPAYAVTPYAGLLACLEGSQFGGPTSNVEEVSTTQGRLGCAKPSVFIADRCGGIFAVLGVDDSIEDLKWDRRLDEISEAEVVIRLGGDSTSTCCEKLALAEPWCHELWIQRDGVDVWAGPISEIIYGYHTVTIRAQDRIAWATARVNEIDIDYAIVADDLTDIGYFILQTAFADDTVTCEFAAIYTSPTGIIGKRFFPAYTEYAYDSLLKLAETGLDFTTIAGTIALTGDLSTSASLALLTDELIFGDIEVKKSGLTQGNRWFVHFDGDLGVPAISDNDADCTVVNQYCYSAIERLRSGDDIPELGMAEEVACDFVQAANIAPRTMEIPPGSKLSPDVPWSINEMVCGVRVDVSITKLCVSLVRSFRLTKVEATYSAGEEEIGVTLSPINSVEG